MVDQVRTLKALLKILVLIINEGVGQKSYEVDGYFNNGKRFKIEVKTKSAEYEDNVIPLNRVRRP